MGFKAGRSCAFQWVGQKLEIKVLEIDEEVAEVVGKSFIDEVVEVDHLEDLYGEEKGIGALEDEDDHYHDGDPTERNRECRIGLSSCLH